MASKQIFNKSTEDSGPIAERLLWLLKTRGDQDATTLATLVTATTEHVRQQLQKIAARGLVSVHPDRGRPGRPRHLWRLSSSGHARFPDTHGELAVQLIRAVREEIGETALDRLISVREKQVATVYRSALSAHLDLRSRVRALAKIRSTEGYMAECVEEQNRFLLIEHHCPICAAAGICQDFCRSELALFRDLLGPNVEVERTEHLYSGGRRCVYAIKQLEGAV